MYDALDLGKFSQQPTLRVVLVLLFAFLFVSACSVADNTANTTANSNNSPLGGSTFPGSDTGSRTDPRSCTVTDMNQWVQQNMLDYYLFYDQVDQNLPIDEFADSESLVKALRVQPQDSFSYMTDETTYNAFFNEGETFGFGWNIVRAADDGIYFSLVDPNSPLELIGVERGDRILSINEYAIDEFFNLSSEQRTQILGRSGESATIELSIVKPSNAIQQLSVTSSSYALQTVLDTQVIEQNGLRIGYLHFYSFISTSSDELEQAFATLAAQNIDELVLDLRFNGGGRVSVANELASHILGSDNSDKVFTTFAYNDKYQQDNVSLNFRDMNSSMDLYRVFILQSASTCSASELVINSLRPFMSVITVGATSCGKPYGSSPNTACSKVLNALEIELLNADNAGGYFDGIAADCPANEDVTKQLGDQSEPLLAAALGYIGNGSCDLATARQAGIPNSISLGTKPAWQGGNNF